MTKLWSHQIAQSPSADPGERETLSKRFGKSIVMILPLSDGRFAIMGADRQLEEILVDAPTAEQLTDYSTRFEARRSTFILRAEGAFYGEPNDRDLARGLAKSRTEKPELTPVGPQEW